MAEASAQSSNECPQSINWEGDSGSDGGGVRTTLVTQALTLAGRQSPSRSADEPTRRPPDSTVGRLPTTFDKTGAKFGVRPSATQVRNPPAQGARPQSLPILPDTL